MKKFNVSVICADLRNRKLLVPASVMSKVYVLTSGEASLFFRYRNRYPDFEIIVL